LLLQPRQILQLLLETKLLASGPPGHQDSETNDPNSHDQSGQPSLRPSEDGTRLVEQPLSILHVERIDIDRTGVGQYLRTRIGDHIVGEVAATTPTELRIPQHRIEHAAGKPEPGTGTHRFRETRTAPDGEVVDDLDGAIDAVAIPTLHFDSEWLGIVATGHLILRDVEQSVVTGVRNMDREPIRQDENPLLTEYDGSQQLTVGPTECLSIERYPVLEHADSHVVSEATHLLLHPIDQDRPIPSISIQDPLWHLGSIDIDGTSRRGVVELRIGEQLSTPTAVYLSVGRRGNETKNEEDA